MKLNPKNKLLLLLSFTALIICYVFSISKTLHYYNYYSKQVDLLTKENNSPEYYAQLLSKEKKYDALLKISYSNSELFQNELLKHLAIQSEKLNLKISEFEQPHVFIDNSILISSYKFSIEGNFNSIITLINTIENKHVLGSIKHISIQKKINHKTSQEYLSATILLQRLDSAATIDKNS